MRQKVNKIISDPDTVWWGGSNDEKFVNGTQLIRYSLYGVTLPRRAANHVRAGNVEHAESKPMAHLIAKTSARRGQSVGGMQTRNLL